VKKQLLEINMKQEFVCLGSECPRTCCHGWNNIEIDAETIDKWKSIQDHEQNLVMQGFIDIGDNDISVMQQTEDNVCTALNEDKLCSIQLQYGHEYLSKVCREFPRLNYENYYRNNTSVSLSCPAIVDNILFDSEIKRMFLVSEINEDN